MTKPSASATSNDGSVIATHTMDSKEHQTAVLVDESGHILGSKDTYFYRIPNQVHVNTANTIHFDMFNADAALLVRILSIKFKPDINTAVTGIVFNWDLIRTTAVGQAERHRLLGFLICRKQH